jgi:hypothetical protein
VQSDKFKNIIQLKKLLHIELNGKFMQIGLVKTGNMECKHDRVSWERKAGKSILMLELATH